MKYFFVLMIILISSVLTVPSSVSRSTASLNSRDPFSESCVQTMKSILGTGRQEYGTQYKKFRQLVESYRLGGVSIESIVEPIDKLAYLESLYLKNYSSSVISSEDIYEKLINSNLWRKEFSMRRIEKFSQLLYRVTRKNHIFTLHKDELTSVEKLMAKTIDEQFYLQTSQSILISTFGAKEYGRFVKYLKSLNSEVFRTLYLNISILLYGVPSYFPKIIQDIELTPVELIDFMKTKDTSAIKSISLKYNNRLQNIRINQEVSRYLSLIGTAFFLYYTFSEVRDQLRQKLEEYIDPVIEEDIENFHQELESLAELTVKKRYLKSWRDNFFLDHKRFPTNEEASAFEIELCIHLINKYNTCEV